MEPRGTRRVVEFWNVAKPERNDGVAGLGSRALREQRQEYRSVFLHNKVNEEQPR